MDQSPLTKVSLAKKNIVLVHAEQLVYAISWSLWADGVSTLTITSYIQITQWSGLCNLTSSHSHFAIIHADGVTVGGGFLCFSTHYSLLWGKCLTEKIWITGFEEHFNLSFDHLGPESVFVDTTSSAYLRQILWVLQDPIAIWKVCVRKGETEKR